MLISEGHYRHYEVKFSECYTVVFVLSVLHLTSYKSVNAYLFQLALFVGLLHKFKSKLQKPAMWFS